ncbi:MAG: hypothetical protein L6Q99_01420 [Planctomycetes bacterium]|nr:hypothetical protein [Planctomycetota bacterium]
MEFWNTSPSGRKSAFGPTRAAQRRRIATSFLIALGCAACSDSKEPTPATGPGAAGPVDADGSASSSSPARAGTGEQLAADQLARERATKFFALGENGRALEALKPLFERKDATETDAVDGAVLELALGDEKGVERLKRVLAANPNSARAHYVLGVWDMQMGEFASAEAHLRKVRELAPDDVPTKLLLAETLENTKLDEAEALYRAVQQRGVDQAGSWYVLAIFRLSGVLMTKPGSDAEIERFNAERFALLKEKEELEARGIKAPQDEDKWRGNLGKVAAPPPTPGAGAKLAASPTFAAAETLLPEFANAEVAELDADDDCKPDLLARSADGALRLALSRGATWQVETLASGALAACAFDFGNDDDLDVAYVAAQAAGGELRLSEAVRDPNTKTVVWRTRDAALFELPGVAESALAGASIVPVDYDHEGDLDLVLVGAFGTRLLRSDGAEKPGGKFTDVTAEAGLAPTRSFAWCVPEDYDTDQDVDLLFGGASTFLASNLRGGKFEDQTPRLAGFASSLPAIVADFDHDSRPDLWSPAAPNVLWFGRPSAKFERRELALATDTAAEPWNRAALVDLDLDGFFDVVGTGANGLAVRRALGWPGGGASEPLSLGGATATGAFVVGDYDADLKPDVLVATTAGVAIARGAAQFGGAVRLKSLGKKDNRRGIGSIVEVRAGGRYQRLYWRGEARLVGVGDAKELDWHRTLWPDGSFQWMKSVALGDRTCLPDALKEFEQGDALRGSCPFLYTWNGTRNVFVSDVLGITPLGLPMAPGMLVPPDHDEYVLVRGDQLAPKDGIFELHFTEELREVTYLDRVRLDVIDHPAGTEIFPNELFTFPPFPTPHVHTVREPLAPLRATGSDGRDWTQALAANDEDFAVPFTPAPAQFRGLANPHFLELEFDPARVADAKKLRLFLNGWFFWTDASVNVASAYDPEQEFVPPIVQVPDGQGGWKDAGPPIGFPAGKTKTMVIDAEALLRRDDPRIRIFSTLRLYWDSIRLGVDADDAPYTEVALEPASAVLWRRGFSAPLVDGKPNQPERFDWDHLAAYPSWNPHPGLYTKYGECLPLVTRIDDRFVILASGDALTVRFDARALPPPKPGFVRDYFLFLDGWAKDRDPNTVEALFVEPLPFHGMSGYPYGPNERFPDDAEHRVWRKEWNTRSAEPWIRSFAEGEPRLAAAPAAQAAGPSAAPSTSPSNATIAPRN